MAISLGLKMFFGRMSALVAGVLTSNLQAWHKFTPTTWSGSNRLPDSSPVATNTAALFTGRGLSFDGVNDLVTIGNIGTTIKTVVFYANPNSGSAVWVQLAASGTTQIVLSGGNISTSGITSPSTYVNGASGTAVSSSTWSMVAVTSATAFAASSVLFGSSGGAFYAGKMANVKFFSTQLNATQIAELYANPEQILPTGASASDLVGWWLLAAGTGSVAYDVSVNNNPGTISGATGETAVPSPATQWALTSQSSPIYFDGTDDRIQSTTSLGAMSGTWSVAMCINTTSATTANLFTAYHGASDFLRIALVTGTEIRALSNSGSTTYASAGSAIAVNNFYHIAVTCNAGTLKIYVNGVSVENGTNTIGLPSVTGWAIGVANATGTSSPYSGFIYNMAVWNVALSGANVTSLYGGAAPTSISAANLKGYWVNTGNQDADWLDKSGNGKNGTVGGTPSTILLPESITSGKDFNGQTLEKTNNGHLILNGTGYASIADAATLDITSAITLECWARPDRVNTAQTLIGKNSAYAMNITSGAKLQLQRWSSASSGTVSSSASLSANTWYHVAATYDGTTTKLYINGALDTTSTAISGSIDATSTAVLLGALTTSTNLLAGTLDNCRIYNAVLTDAQILSNYSTEQSSYS